MSAPSQNAPRPAGAKARGLQVIDGGRDSATTLPIEPVRERIFRDWLRGISERSLRATYRKKRKEIEDSNRAQALALRAELMNIRRAA